MAITIGIKVEITPLATFSLLINIAKKINPKYNSHYLQLRLPTGQLIHKTLTKDIKYNTNRMTSTTTGCLNIQRTE